MRTRIKRIKKNVDLRIFDNYVSLYGKKEGVKKYKYSMFKNEFNSIKNA